MVKKIRVKKTEKWEKVDRSLISSLEFKCLDGGHMVNITDGVAREMIRAGWVINIDPMKDVKTERSVMEMIHKHPDLAKNVPGVVVNPGLVDEEETDDKGTGPDVPPERPDEQVQPDKKSGNGSKKRPARRSRKSGS